MAKVEAMRGMGDVGRQHKQSRIKKGEKMWLTWGILIILIFLLHPH
jgi:hypothetical protein